MFAADLAIETGQKNDSLFFFLFHTRDNELTAQKQQQQVSVQISIR
jgi:hypothetical protein